MSPATAALPPANGTAPQLDKGRLEELLTKPMTDGYKPTLPLWALWTTDAIPQFYLLRDIELMLIHPIVRNTLDYYKSGIAGAEFWGGPDPANPQQGKPISQDPEVASFVHEHCQRYWDYGVPKLQGGYEYGWIGCESLYGDRS